MASTMQSPKLSAAEALAAAQSAVTKASSAAASATSAAESAALASSKAGEAIAAAARTEAVNSDADASARVALAARDAAQTAEHLAEEARDISIAAADQANAKAAEAAGSAGTASTKAADASTSATAAAGSAGTASTKADEASASATAAAASASTASAKADEAAASAAAAKLGLAPEPGLEFAAGLLRVKAGTGLVRSASGLAADVGATAGKLVQLDESGRLPALDGRNLTNLPSATDLAAFHAFVASLAAGRATSGVPGGGIWLFVTDEMTKTGATYDSVGKAYSASPNFGANIATSAQAISGGNLYPVTAAFDGLDSDSNSSSTSWASSQTGSGVSGAAYLGQHFSTPQRIGRARVYQDVGIGVCSSVKVQYSTNGGASWSDAGTFAAVAGANVFEFAPASANDWRILANSNPSGYWGVSELSMHPVASVSNMSLSSPSGVALGFVPIKATIYLLHKSIDALTYNTDIKLKAARGGSYVQAADLAKVCAYDGTYDLLKASVDLSVLASGSTGLWGLDTYNNKAQQVRAALVLFN